MNRYDTAQTNACNLTRSLIDAAQRELATALDHVGSDPAADALRNALASLTTALRVNADITHDTVMHYADHSDECPECSTVGAGTLCKAHRS